MKRIIFLGALVCHFGSFAQDPTLGSLKKDGNSASLKYVAVGSVLSSGVRDGGVFEAAQNTSFPALLAEQMGVKDFKQPLLTANGTGFKTASIDRNGLLKFQVTKGIDDTQRNANLPRLDIEVDNLAIPYQKVLDIYSADENKVNSLFDNRSFRHLQRFSKSDNTKVSYFDIVKAKAGKIDFFTFEFGFHDFIQFIEAGGYATDISYLSNRESIGEEVLLKILKENSSSGVILNVPDYLRFPIFKRYSLSKLQASTDATQIYIEHWQKNHVRVAQKGDIFLPRNSVVSLIEKGVVGTTEENPIKDEDVLDVEEQRFARASGYNEILLMFSGKYKLPIVDLYTVYNQILDGEYITEEGITIDPSFPGGNFFSQDGITPTALGQAIITNEIIKVVNSNYHSNIPLVSLKKFL